MGELNLHPEVFWDLSIAEFEVKCEGYFLRIDREWEQTRFIAAYLHTRLSGKVMTPEKLRPTIFDKDKKKRGDFKEADPITKQDVLDFQEKWLKNN